MSEEVEVVQYEVVASIRPRKGNNSLVRLVHLDSFASD